MPTYCFQCKSPKVQEIVEGTHVLYQCPGCGHKGGRAFIIDNKIRTIKTSRGIKHIAVAALIIENDHLLVVDRRTYPFGLELPAGHVEYDETLEEALRREVYEEVGIKVTGATLLAQLEHPISYCRYGSDVEEWSIFLIEGRKGETIASNSEVESSSWIPLKHLHRYNLTEPTRVVLGHLGYLSTGKQPTRVKT